MKSSGRPSNFSESIDSTLKRPVRSEQFLLFYERYTDKFRSQLLSKFCSASFKEALNLSERRSSVRRSYSGSQRARKSHDDRWNNLAEIVDPITTRCCAISSHRSIWQVRSSWYTRFRWQTYRICFRKVFRVMVEPLAGRLGGAINAVLRVELLRRTTQVIQPTHRSSAHLTIEIFPIDSRLCLAEDDHPLFRHGLLIVNRTSIEKPPRASAFTWVRHHTSHTAHHTSHVTRHTLVRDCVDLGVCLKLGFLISVGRIYASFGRTQHLHAHRFPIGVKYLYYNTMKKNMTDRRVTYSRISFVRTS